MELPKKWFVEVTNENKEVLNKWRLSQPDVIIGYDHRFKAGCLIISDGYGDKSYFYMSGKESFLREDTHVEITYEDFVKYVLTIDYTIPGTKLPEMSGKTLKRCVHWEDSSEDEPFYSIKRDYISYGSKMFNGHLYILNEKQGYIESNYFMVKLYDIERLAKEQNFNQKQEETMKQITSVQAQQIIDIACITLKDKLATKWGRKIVFKETIEISNNDYQEMRKACTAPQNELFDEIFGKNVEFIPEGVACLVRDTEISSWILVYSNGNGKFKGVGPICYTWEYVQILDVNNLPKY